MNNIDKKVYIETYGCQMNVYDSELALSILKDDGFERTENIEEADLILVNTCSIRDNAEQRIWGRVNKFHAEKKKNKNVLIGILGCMAERLKDKLLAHRDINLVLGPDNYRDLPRLLEALENNNKQMSTELSKDETYSDIVPVRTDENGVSAYISIMRGCNNYCTYCVVPYTRGVERSRNPQSIIKEAKDLFNKGYKEVNLLGQNVNSYMWMDSNNTSNTVDFSQLLEMVALISPQLRVRFSTSHPKDMKNSVLYTIAMYPNICNHIHLPVQSGSTRILKKMHRIYTREEYLERIYTIKKILPTAGITTDIITGFCSETEEDHKETLSLMEEVKYDWSFMFQYSERPGTMAAERFPDDVSPETKARRLNEIIELQTKLSMESNKKDIGRKFEVLVEGFSKKSDKQLFGRTSENKVCVFPAGNYKPGDYVNVLVESCTSATLLGIPTKE